MRLKGVPISCEVQEENALITNSIWSKEDAVKFVKKLKPYAGHNPYLMNHALTALGDAKELDVEARTIGICIQKTQQYIERILPKENLFFYTYRKLLNCYILPNRRLGLMKLSI